MGNRTANWRRGGGWRIDINKPAIARGFGKAVDARLVDPQSVRHPGAAADERGSICNVNT